MDPDDSLPDSQNKNTSTYDAHGFSAHEDYVSLFTKHFAHEFSSLNETAENVSSEFADGNLSGDQSNQDIFKNLPTHACRYCGQSNPECVAQCNICSHWFCNTTSSGSSASHVVHHLIRSKHKELRLHQDSPLEGAVLECYNCGSKNIFSLGFVPAKSESLVLLLCRSPCAYQHTAREYECDLSLWEPVVSDRRLSRWLVKAPSPEDMVHIRQVGNSQIAAIEEYLRMDPKAVYQDVSTEIVEEPVNRTRLRYKDANEYMDIYLPLINLESDFDKRLKESQAQNNITIRTEINVNKKKLIYFNLPQSDTEMRLMQGDDLQLIQTRDNKTTKLQGSVIKIPNNYGEDVGIELKYGCSLPESTSSWTVEFVWKPVTFDRMSSALKSFLVNESETSEYIRSKLLGHATDEETIKIMLPKRFSAPGLPELNHSQVFAVKTALQKPLSLIQGPPGTGKTVTSAALVYHIIKQCGGQVLVCAPSNIAVDQLAEKINRTGLKVVRVCAKSREDIDSPVSHLALHNQLKCIEDSPELTSLRKLRQDQGDLTSEDHKRYNVLLASIEKELLSKAEVVCTTCIGAGDYRVRGIKFRCVLLDESTQATEPECMVPAVLAVRQLILVGDHCQLGPVVMCKKAASAGFSRSLFERLIELGVKPLRLQVQYRMHPALSEFSSNFFYEGTLQNGVTVVERSHPGVDFPWPIPEKPMFFYCSYGPEEISSSGTSYLNRTEAVAVETFATRLIKSGVKALQIGIITPYEGQRAYLVAHMVQCGHLSPSQYQNIEIASVDAFQGREKDYIIMSCVRSNDYQGIGFLVDSRRLNVAITRARFGLIIIGNPKILCHHTLWNSLLNDYQEKGLLVEGPINSMQTSQILLHKPGKFCSPKISDDKSFSANQGDSVIVKPERQINDYIKNHDRFNLLHPFTVEQTISAEAPSIPVNMLIPPIPISNIQTVVVEPDASQVVPTSSIEEDIISFAKNFAAFNLDNLIHSNEESKPAPNNHT